MMSSQVAKRGAWTSTAFLNNNVPAFCLTFRDALQSIYINIQLYDECISKFKEDKQNQRVWWDISNREINKVGWFWDLINKVGWLRDLERSDWSVKLAQYDWLLYRATSFWATWPNMIGCYIEWRHFGPDWVQRLFGPISDWLTQFLIGWPFLTQILIGWPFLTQILIGWPFLAQILIGWAFLAQILIGWPFLAQILIGWPFLTQILIGCPFLAQILIGWPFLSQVDVFLSKVPVGQNKNGGRDDYREN